MIREMSKIKVIGSKRAMKDVIEKLHDLKVMHITENEENLKIGESLPDAEKISSSLVQLRSAISVLGISGETETKEGDIGKAIAKSEAIASKAFEYMDNIRRNDIQKKMELLGKVLLLKKVGLEGITDISSIAVFFGTASNSADVENNVRKITSRYSLKSNIEGKKEYIGLCIDRKQEEKARKILASNNFSAIDVADVKGLNAKMLHDEIDGMERLRKESEQAIEKIKAEHSAMLLGYEKLLSRELEKLQAPLLFGETEKSFIATGFLPAESVAKATKEIRKAAKERIIIETEEITEEDIVPVELENPKHVSDFQFFIDLFSIPRYKEIDPTWFLFITFPLMFGFMLGDIGYGIATLIIFWLLKKKMPKFSRFFNILIFSSFASILFCGVFGEFFGKELYHPMLNRNPEHAVEPLIITAIAIGIVHINIGLVLGFINEKREHGFKKAFLAKGGWWIMQIGFFMLLASLTGIIKISFLAGLLIILAAGYIIYLGEGLAGIVEIPSIFGNILSYARLMAIGLSSVGLALVINDISSGLLQGSIISIIIGVIVFAVGHAINIALGCLGCFLHSLRLHYV